MALSGWTIVSKFLNVCFGIIVVVLSALSYANICDPPNFLSDIVDNWKTSSIYQITTVDSGQSCPFGYSMASTLGQWPGTSEGCYCSGTKELSSGNCTTVQIGDGCSQVASTTAFEMRVWRNRVLCLLRAGTSIYWAPQPNSDGTCNSKKDIYGNDVLFTRCGTGDASTCIETSLGCPINQILLQSSGSPRPADYDNSVYFGDDLVLYYNISNQNSSSLPIIDIAITDGLACYDKPSYQENMTSYSLLLSTPSSCDFVDSRYTVLDSLSDVTYYSENDYQNITGLPLLAMSTLPNWQFSYRRSILWKEKCFRGRYARSNVHELDDPINEARDLQLMLLVVDSILALALIVIDPLMWVVCFRTTKDKLDEFSDGLLRLRLMELLKKLVSVPFVAYVSFRITFIHSWFYDIEHYCCSDGLTNSSFDIVDYALDATYRYNWANFAVTVFVLLADVAIGVVIFVQKTQYNFRPL